MNVITSARVTCARSRSSVRNRAKFLAINFYFVLWFSPRCSAASNATQTVFSSISDQRTKHKRYRSGFFFVVPFGGVSLLYFSAIYWKIFDSIQTLEASSSSTSRYSVVWRSHASQETKWKRRKWNKILRMLTALASVQSTCNSVVVLSVFITQFRTQPHRWGRTANLSHQTRAKKRIKNANEATTYEILFHCDHVDVWWWWCCCCCIRARFLLEKV